MDIKLLEKLCMISSVSGRESKIANIIKEYMTPLCDDIYTDALGNLVCCKKGLTDKTVVLDAHMDSVGFIVTKVYDDGFLEFNPIGGIDSRILSSQEVVVQGKSEIPGIITSKPPHLTASSDKNIDMKNLFIDTGIIEGIDKIVSVGDVVSFKPSFSVLNKYISATSLDNKTGVSMIIELFKSVENSSFPFNLTAIFSVREEIGLRGAAFSDINSSLTVVIDVTFGKTPDENRDMVFTCGDGAAIGYGPNIDPYYHKLLCKCADKHNIAYQNEILEGSSGTNAWSYQTLRKGTNCLLISVPLKYMHTPVECISIKDYDSALKHLNCFISELDAELIKSCDLVDIGDCNV